MSEGETKSEEAMKTTSGKFGKGREAQRRSMRGMHGRGRRRAPARMACAALLSCAAMLAACGGGGGSSTAPPEMMPPEMMPPAAQAALTVMAGDSASGGGSVSVVVGSGATDVPAGTSMSVSVAAGDTATLTAAAAAGYEFTGWTLSGGLACADGPAGNPCTLAAGSVSTDTTVEAAFEAVPTTLTVTAGPNGSVDVDVGGAGAAEVGASSSQGFTVSVLSAATLTATAASGYAFTGWTLSGPSGLACASGAQANPCVLPAGSLSADATATATFGLRPPAAWRGPGSVSVSLSGSTHTAVPYAPGAFEGWDGAPCDGSREPACDVSPVMAGEGLPVAVFRPFVVGGIKSLAFGLGYHGDPPDHFEVSFQDAMGAGFTPVPSLGSLAPGSGPARLAVSVHLLPWEVGAYMTRACDATNSCAIVDGGEQRTLEQTDSVAATGYFKASVAGEFDVFGFALALSADGATLAVGAPGEDSASTGTFAPGGTGYQTALDSNSADDSGAVTVYRRSDSEWSVEAFVKAPNADADDEFGTALALSRDGATLAVGAPSEDSASAGTFAPGDGGYQAALDSNVGDGGGAVTVYRRSGSAWSVEAFVKAPRAAAADQFGEALALSADGATLAVGAPGEDSASTGTFAPGGMGYRAALDSDGAGNSGAVTVYRRSVSEWSVEAFVKAPVAGVNDQFGFALALSEDSSTLAVGAFGEDSASTGTFAPGGTGYQTALDSGDSGDSGAVTVYRRSGSAWRVEAFVKAPGAGAGDQFGTALALSGDGAALAVGARRDGSSYTGTFAPGGTDYQAALDSDGAGNSGAVTAYRRSGSAWSIEAFVKAPVAVDFDEFGGALALSADGATLAVGARFEDSSHTGAFTTPGDDGYQAALDSVGASGSGAVTAYRRSGSTWSAGAFIKAPLAGSGDQFGTALALSGDGATLAVGARFEDGSALPQPVGGDSADTGNAVENSGAVYLY